MDLANKIVQMNKRLIVGLTALAVAGAMAVSSLGVNAASRNEFPTDKQFECFEAAKSRSFTEVKETGGQIHGRILVPQDCEHLRVTLVVYKLLDGNWEHKNANQVIFDTAGGREFNSGTHTLIVNKPNCGWQADLIYGFVPVQHPNPQIQKPVYDSAVGGNGVPCAEQPVPKPPVPTPPSTTTTTVTQEQEQEQSVNVSNGREVSAVKAADVKELPNTGPGAVVATFVGASSLGSLLYTAVSRRFGL